MKFSIKIFVYEFLRKEVWVHDFMGTGKGSQSPVQVCRVPCWLLGRFFIKLVFLIGQNEECKKILNTSFFGISDVRSKGERVLMAFMSLVAAVNFSVERNGLKLFWKTKLVFTVLNFLKLLMAIDSDIITYSCLATLRVAKTYYNHFSYFFFVFFFIMISQTSILNMESIL